MTELAGSGQRASAALAVALRIRGWWTLLGRPLWSRAKTVGEACGRRPKTMQTQHEQLAVVNGDGSQQALDLGVQARAF